MRLIEMADLKDFGKNNLRGFGLALTSFVVTYSVIKVCACMFQDRSETAKKAAGKTKPESLKIFIYQIIAIGLSQLACDLLTKKIGLARDHRVNPQVLVLHAVALAIASIWDKRKIVSLGIGLSAACVLLEPKFFSMGGACMAGCMDMCEKGL